MPYPGGWRCGGQWGWGSWQKLRLPPPPGVNVVWGSQWKTQQANFQSSPSSTSADFVLTPDLPQQSPSNTSLAEWINTLQDTWPVVHKALEVARETQKGDGKRVTPKEFKIGEPERNTLGRVCHSNYSIVNWSPPLLCFFAFKLYNLFLKASFTSLLWLGRWQWTLTTVLYSFLSRVF